MSFVFLNSRRLGSVFSKPSLVTKYTHLSSRKLSRNLMEENNKHLQEMAGKLVKQAERHLQAGCLSQAKRLIKHAHEYDPKVDLSGLMANVKGRYDEISLRCFLRTLQ